MPNHTIALDIFDEMLDNISFIKLNTYLHLSENE